MSTSEGTEKNNVRAEIEKYYNEKRGYDFRKFGKFEKILLGGRTYLYIVETIMGEGINFALVPVNRANVQGIIILNSEQVSKMIKRFIDGLTKEFGN